MAIIEINGYKVIVDDEDVQRVQEKKWYLNKMMAKTSGRYYFYHDEKNNKIRHAMLLHRFIMNCKKGDGTVIDHINGDTLDCRKENLRFCTMKQNMQNSRGIGSVSGYKGVHWLPQVKKWQVRLRLDGTTHYFGMYNNPIDGAKIYDIAALHYFKEFARTNFPKKEYQNIDLCAKLIELTPSFSSIYRGVCLDKFSGKYTAYITKNKIRYYLGFYDNEQEAALAYNKKLIELNGNKSKLNIVIS